MGPFGATRRGLLRTAAGLTAGAALGAACGAPAPGASGPAVPSTEPVRLEFQHRWEGARTEVVDRIVADYRRLHPNVQIESQLVFGSGQGFFDGMPYDKILTQIAAGTPPDVIMMGSDVASAWARRGNALRALDEHLKRDKIEPEKVFYVPLAQMARSPGKYYGLPQLTATDRAYLFMNQAVVAAAGLDPQKGPQSWDELVDWSTKLTRRDGTTLTQIGLASPGAPFIDWLARNNGKVLTDDGKKIAFDNAAGQETLQWMLDSTNRLYGGVQPVKDLQATDRNATYTGKVNLWTSQVAGFFTTLSDAPKVNAGFQLAVSIVPHNAKNAQARPLSIAEKIWMYSQASGTSGARVDTGYDFLKYLTLGEGNKSFVLNQSRPSPVVQFNDEPAFKQQNPWWDSQVKRALSLMTPIPQTPVWADMRTVLDKMTDQVLAGGQSVRDGLAAAGRECQRLLDDASK
jgi:ABC-type glycerol-3-phosphate transport system substrate-binding protein